MRHNIISTCNPEDSHAARQQWLQDLTRRLYQVNTQSGSDSSVPTGAQPVAASAKYLLVHAAMWQFAVPLTMVSEVLSPQHITPVPFVACCVRGLIQLRGEMLSVVALSQYFDRDRPPADLREDSRLLVVRHPQHPVATALLVDGVARLPRPETDPDGYEALMNCVPVIPRDAERFPLLDTDDWSEVPVPVVDLHRLIGSAEFARLSSRTDGSANSGLASLSKSS